MVKVLITGGSGFVATHCILRALADGHEVNASLRSLQRAEDVRSALVAGGLPQGLLAKLTFFAADLSHDEGWREAVQGCSHVLHVASPFPATPPSDPQEIIRPARDGTLRVLRASIAERVNRVVMTSSFAAIGYGHDVVGRPFDEHDWTDIDGPGVHPYIQSKTIAERAAWDLMRADGNGTELSVINPTGIFGPTLRRALSSSVDLVRQLMAGEIAVAPSLCFGVVDVRDVADLHLLAMTAPGAAGERFLATTEPQQTLLSVAQILGQAYPSLHGKLPTREHPAEDHGLPDPSALRRQASAAKARAFGWSPRSPSQAILDTAESLISLGLIAHPG